MKWKNQVAETCMYYDPSYVKQISRRIYTADLFSKNSHSSISSHTCFSGSYHSPYRDGVSFPSSWTWEQACDCYNQELSRSVVCTRLLGLGKKSPAAAWFSPSSILSWDGCLPLEPSHHAVRKPSSHMKSPYIGVLADSTRQGSSHPPASTASEWASLQMFPTPRLSLAPKNPGIVQQTSHPHRALRELQTHSLSA